MIRLADKHDLSCLLDMAREMHAASAYKNIEFVPNMTRNFLDFVVEGEDYIALVAEVEATPVGAIIGCISPYFFNPALRICDLSFYVRPEWRGSTAAPRLLKHYEKLAKERGCRESYLGVSTGDGAAGAFYQGMGYTNIGTCFKKEL